MGADLVLAAVERHYIDTRGFSLSPKSELFLPARSRISHRWFAQECVWMSKHKARPSARARQVRLAMVEVRTLEIEAAWEPIATRAGIPARLWVEKFLITLMKNASAFDSLIEGLSDGTLLAALTTEIDRRTKS